MTRILFFANFSNKLSTATLEGAQHKTFDYGSTGCGVFKQGVQDYKDFLHKNQHTQRKLLNFEFCINGELSKIWHHFSK